MQARMMMTSMISPCHNREIFNSIVSFIMVNMMNNFTSFKFSTKMTLHNIAMFWDIFPIHPNSNIFPNSSTSFPMSSILVFTSARKGTINPFPLTNVFVWPDFKIFFAKRTFLYEENFCS